MKLSGFFIGENDLGCHWIFYELLPLLENLRNDKILAFMIKILGFFGAKCNSGHSVTSDKAVSRPVGR